MLKIIHTFVPYIITFTNHIFLFLMKKRLLRTMLMALCGGAVALTACVDKDYDLTNLDTTMKVGNGTFMLPTSSTEDIQLNNLFSLTDDGAVMESADGFYYLHKGGSSTEQVIHIEDIAIPSPTIQPFSVPLDGRVPAAAVKSSMPLKAPGSEEPTYLWEYPFEEKTTLSYDAKNSNDINADVLSIDNIKFGNDQLVSFTITVSNYGKKLNNLRFGTLRIELPLGFDIEKATYNDNHPDYQDKEPKDWEGHIIEITPQLETNKQVLLFATAPLELAKTNKANIVLKLKGAYMGNKYRRLIWDRPGACIATRSDIMSSQDTIHPCDNRVLSIRELMTLMTIPNSFQWTDHDSELTVENSDEYLKDNEGNIRRCIGEAVPTQIGRDIAEKISRMLDYEDFVKSGEPKKTDSFFVAAHNSFGEILPYEAFQEISKLKQDVKDISAKIIGIKDFLTFVPQLISFYSHIDSITIDVFNLTAEEEKSLLVILNLLKVGSNVRINISEEKAVFDSYNLIVENAKCRHFLINETRVKRTSKSPQAEPLQLSLF